MSSSSVPGVARNPSPASPSFASSGRLLADRAHALPRAAAPGAPSFETRDTATVAVSYPPAAEEGGRSSESSPSQSLGRFYAYRSG